jgi:hypothetical protein
MKPILFSGEMVRAILDGRKTMTRRILGNKKIWPCDLIQDSEIREGKEVALGYEDEYGNWHTTESACPYGGPGDRLWVRETWQGTPDCISYRATDPRQVIEFNYDRWCPSIFMPRWASRITLEITNVRVEKLREITEEDAIREGIPSVYENYSNAVQLWSEKHKKYFTGENHISVFQQIWNSINGKKHPWDANPWVWVISFRRINPTQ